MDCFCIFAYEAPVMEVFDLKIEGIICQSNSDSVLNPMDDSIDLV
jgi:hypothetical protein